MNQVLFEALGIKVTTWKLVGYLGTFLFAGRWFVQMLASRRHGKPTLPITFWYLSLAGSALTLSYFIFGKNDSVGVMGNLFPFFVACYNLKLVMARKRDGKE